MYENVKARVHSELKSAETVAITTDSWSSRANENYIAVTGHFVDLNDDWQVKAYTLQTKKFTDKYTAKNLATISTISVWEL